MNRYEQVIEKHKNSDNYITNPTQTMNNPVKHQNDMAQPNATQDFECQTTIYDILDVSNGIKGNNNENNEISGIFRLIFVCFGTELSVFD